MALVHVVVHCGGSIDVSPVEGVTFNSPSPQMIHLRRDVTLQRMKIIILKKLNRDSNERVASIRFRYPIRIGPGVNSYTAVELKDDEDVQAMFSIQESTQFQAGLEIYVTFESGPSSSTQLHSPQPSYQPQPYSPHPYYQPEAHSPHSYYQPEPHSPQPIDYMMNPHVPYTQLLTGGFTSQSELQSPPIQEAPVDQHAVVGLPTEEVFDPFSEDENEILSQHQDDEEDEQLNAVPNIQPQQQYLSYNPPQHFLDFPSHVPADDAEFGHVLDRETTAHPPGSLFVTQRFRSKEQVQDAINRYHIMNHCTYKVKLSSQQRLVVECVDDECNWRCRAIKRTRDEHWEIMKLEEPHTCVSPLISQDHNKLGSRLISQTIREIVEADPSTPISTIVAHIKSTMGYTITYRKGWLAKQKAIENIYGNWEESYQKLPSMLQAM